MKIIKNKACLLLTIYGLTYSLHANAGFYDERYRGWLWFEEKIKEEESEYKQLTPEQAIAYNKAFKKKLKGLRYVLFANPTAENLKNYLEFENKMWNNVDKLDSTIRLARYKYPELFDTIKEPTNVQAVKLQRNLNREVMQKNIKDFALKFDLVVFTKESCPYCQAFAPVLDNFAKTYGFKVEAASLDGSESNVFKTAYIPGLAERLKIEAAPTLVAISHDGSQAFEIVRGVVAISELEEFVSLANQYVSPNKQGS
ncbi:MAG: hypothetical protein K0R02_711 [Rickettsiaceae bacterium]|jgi:conjugal transfer pilus assembly protein TraF|nr:hypothetical protein [Rickettsiaceae bacterium]